MVVGPFSIAGAVGLAAGLAGFVASTIEKAVGQVNTATHAEQRLNGHQLALKTCQERLGAWARQWHENDGLANERLDDGELRFLWGHEGLEQVELMKTAILLEQEDLCKLLYGRSCVNFRTWRDQRRWEEYIQGAQARQVFTVPKGNTPAPLADVSGAFLRRIKTALWNESLLLGSVGRLEKRVETLERTSCMCFRKAHPNGSSHYTQPSQEEIGSVIRQQRRMQHLFHDLLDAYDDRLIHRSGLSFTPFQDAEICQLGTQHELTVTFLIVRLRSTPYISMLISTHCTGFSTRLPWQYQAISSLNYYVPSGWRSGHTYPPSSPTAP